MKASEISAKFLTAAVVLAVCASADAKPGQPVSYWPFKAGSTWTLTTMVNGKMFDQVVTVTHVASGVATLDYKVNGKLIQGEKYRFDAAQITRMSSGPNAANTITPPIPIIKYPLKAGDRWRWQGSINQDGTVSQGSGELSVSGPEKVTTPAGSFNAMKVRLNLTISAQGQKLSVPNDYWFAPNVGLIKQKVSVAGMNIYGELKSYKLK